MSKKSLYIGGLIIIVIVGLFVFSKTNKIPSSSIKASNYKDATYTIEGQKIKLTNGISEMEAAPGSASKITTTYFGNEVRADLNNDGREDVVFLITQNTGGSGNFYYVVAALNTLEGYIGSEGLLLGDRIAPQTTEMSRNPAHVNVIVVNYADRNSGEPMTARPSLGKSIWLKLDVETMQFGEVVQNFEGEASPSVMSLPMKTWIWINAMYNDGKIVTPVKTKAFTITFGKDGRFSATTDCNNVGGSYTVNKNQIVFGQMMSTKMFCEGSQEDTFVKLISESQDFLFTSKGELVLGLKVDSGSVTFK